MTAHPYRIGERPTPRFMCLSCHRTASVSEAGTCTRCGVPRLPLEDAEVREDLRACVERIQQRALGRRVVLELTGFSALAIALYVLLGIAGMVDLHQPHLFRHLLVNEFVFIPLWITCVFGGAFLVERRAKRHAVVTDPTGLKIPELLRVLEIEIED